MKTPTEIPLKQWRYEEAKRCNLDEKTLMRRIKIGTHPKPSLRRVNSRVIFVLQPITSKP